MSAEPKKSKKNRGGDAAELLERHRAPVLVVAKEVGAQPRTRGKALDRDRRGRVLHLGALVIRRPERIELRQDVGLVERDDEEDQELEHDVDHRRHLQLGVAAPVLLPFLRFRVHRVHSVLLSLCYSVTATSSFRRDDSEEEARAQLLRPFRPRRIKLVRRKQKLPSDLFCPHANLDPSSFRVFGIGNDRKHCEMRVLECKRGKETIEKRVVSFHPSEIPDAGVSEIRIERTA